MLDLILSLASKEDKKQLMNSGPLSSATFRNLLYLTRFLSKVRKMKYTVEYVKYTFCVCVRPYAFHLKLLDSL